MPNWCSNKLEISFNTEAELESFVRFLEGGEDSNQFDFNLFVPCPKVIQNISTTYLPVRNRQSMQTLSYSDPRKKMPGRRGETLSFSIHWRDAERLQKRFGSTNWYDWNLEKWGTKWNTSDAVFQDVSGTCVEIYFDTAWSPPAPVIDAMAKMFPSAHIEFSYMETGCDFGGFVVYDNGVRGESLSGTALQAAYYSPWHSAFISSDDEDEEGDE